MGRIARHVGRTLFAYGLSSLITGMAVYVSLLFNASSSGNDAYQGGPAFGLMIAMLVAWFASSPAALTVIVGEWLAWRTWWFYSLSGSLIGLVLGILFKIEDYFPWFGLGFGVVSGAIFWWLAGRFAGLTNQRERKIVAAIIGLIGLVGLFVSVPGLVGL